MSYKRTALIFIFLINAVLLSAGGIAVSDALFTTVAAADAPNFTGDATGTFTTTQVTADGDWAMVAANPQRTSRSSAEVTGNLSVAWYRPIEAYIPQNSQIIAANGLVYVATSRGLYALNADTGAVAWRYDTELPLGNSPTVDGDVLYVGGYDRKLHALNALDGTHLWDFSGAGAGYDTNPLVVDGKVFVGNRDGKMYAIGAQGTPQQGQLIWQYDTGAPIHLSAAYKDGVIFFAADDNHAYALDANDGHLVWKSAKMPGAQFQSYWPVIFQDKVIFSVASGYRNDLAPGTRSVSSPDNTVYPSLKYMQLADIFPNGTEGQIIGAEVSGQSWAHGFPVVDAHSVTEYLEDNPQSDPYKHKPWRRMLVALNISNGQEYSFDSDGDGFREYIPASYWGTTSGNRYPPIVGSDNLLYFGSLYRCCSDAKGRIMGWNPDAPGYVSFLGAVQAPTGGFAAVAEPQAISAGGNVIYRNLCCDRVGDWMSYTTPGASGQVWSYNLDDLAPGYDSMWFIDPSAISRHRGWYQGLSGSMNAAYHNHGDQNPIVPYNGKLFVHRSNTVFAFSAGGNASSPLPVLTANPAPDSGGTLSTAEVSQRLNAEVQKIVNAGHLRPGYYHARTLVRGVENYFENPGDTLFTLSVAYPYLSSSLQAQVRDYLATEFNNYFANSMIARVGWSDGAPREWMDLPPEVASDIAAGNYPSSTRAGSGFIWAYPQNNFYAMWKYAANVPGVDAQQVYSLAKSKIIVPVPNPPVSTETDYFRQQPYELNGWIAGYIGFLNLQSLAGMDGTDANLRARVSTELDRLMALRANIFTKESYYNDPNAPGYKFYKKNFDIVSNFWMIVPELGEYLRQNKESEVRAAIDEYNYIAPYWFVSRYEDSIGERGMSLLYNYYALFQAKAFILHESPAELSKYLDVPAFAVGDLFYIQNLVAVLSVSDYVPVPDFSVTVTPTFQNIAVDGNAQYAIQIQPVNGFSATITINADVPTELVSGLVPRTLDPTSQTSAELSLSYGQSSLPDGTPGQWFSVPIEVSGGGISRSVTVSLLVGGVHTHLPLVLKNY